MWFTSLTLPTQIIAPVASVDNTIAQSTRAVREFSTLRRYRKTSFVLINSVTTSTAVAGQVVYTGEGGFTWTAPAGVTGVAVVCIGGGSGSWDGWANHCGGGGGLGWKNNIPVTPGVSYSGYVGDRGYSYPNTTGSAAAMIGGNSYFISLATVAGYGGGQPQYNYTNGPNANGAGGGYTGDGGGAGGSVSNWQGGGGAGGYLGRGGNSNENASGYQVEGGGAGGGRTWSSTYGTGAGGGVGYMGVTGHNSPGNAQYSPFQGYGNSNIYGGGGAGSHGGGNGQYGENPFSGSGQSSNNIQGGTWGGGGGGPGSSWPSSSGNGGPGVVRIMWTGGTSTTTVTNDNVDEVLVVTTTLAGGAVPRAYPQSGVADQ